MSRVIDSTLTMPPSAITLPPPPDSSKPFQRIRSSLEQSLRTATRSKKHIPTKGKERQLTEDIPKDKERSYMLRKFMLDPYKVSFRRAGRDSVSPHQRDDHDTRLPGFTSPSLRQASMSSPALHLSSSKSRSPIPSRQLHRTTKSNSPPLPPSPSSPSLPINSRSNRRDTPLADTPAPRRLSPRTATKPSPPITTRAQSPSAHVRVITPPPRIISSSPRRPSLESPQRPVADAQRRVVSHTRSRSPSMDRTTESPPPTRLRTISPAHRSYSQNRNINMSSLSLVSPYNPEHRESIRNAIHLLCKEVLKPPPHMSRTESGIRDWKEVEIRTRALARYDRMYGSTSGGNSSNTSLSGITAQTASGEERERRLFSDAVKDGYVLCQLMNKLRSSSVVKPDAREDPAVRSSNITRFLAACASYGLSEEDLFQYEDLLDASSESLARVANTITTLIKFVESPMASRSKYLSGQVHNPGSSSALSPYSQVSTSRASASTPNLHPITNVSLSPPSPVRKRWSPPSDLPTVHASSEEGSPKLKASQKLEKASSRNEQEVEIKDMPAPPALVPPPRSPLRSRSAKRVSDDGGVSAFAKSAASPTRSSIANSTRASIGNASIREPISDPLDARYSMASSMMTDTTVTTAISSILDAIPGGSSYQNKFGTIRTVTTDFTSEAPSISRAEGDIIAEDLARKRTDSGAKHGRERRLSEAHPVDLSRVAEETDDGGSSNEAKRNKGAEEHRATKSPVVHLGKGKFPDDFLDAFQIKQSRSVTPKPSPPIATQEESTYNSGGPVSISPPRKIAVVGAMWRNESQESVNQVPRRSSHRPRHSVDALIPKNPIYLQESSPDGAIPRARHSVDAPILLPKDPILQRESSPDGAPSASGRVLLRRNTTKPSVHTRNGVHLAKGSLEASTNEEDGPVPFPRTVSAEHRNGTPSPNASGETVGVSERPRLIRGRFQSDIEGSASRRRARPSSYDDVASPRHVRTRFESMVNLGATSGLASASDIMSRNSLDGNAVRKTLVVREDGKPPTQFQLGNCIGRGQFGSVYRALNLNTGQMVAVKRIRLEGLKEEEVTTLMREVDLVKSLSHPSIVKYEGMARDDDTLNIVLEYVENGSLGQTLKSFGKLNERLVASYVVKILEGLHYLHRSDVVHCDLKAANILTTKNGNVKLSDFGVSLNLRAMARDIADTVAGTPNWMAPEVIELKGASTKSDIWSLACTVIELLTGRPPYADIANGMSVMFHIVDDPIPPLPEGCSPLLEDFLTRCFDKDPAKRPSAEMLCEHPWLKKNWYALQDLRPQDSIPFLRRVSADLQKSDAVRLLNQHDKSDSPTPEESRNISPVKPRISNASLPPLPSLADNDISPREHTFVKTTFGKPMVCRVCQVHVKKSAVFCSQCSLISHSKCAVNAPPTCDLRAQLLLYAQYAENGNPASVYYNPSADMPNDARPKGAMSDVPFVTHSPRTSIDTPPPLSSPNPPLTSQHPPTAFKFTSVFRRSRSNLSPEPLSGSAPSSAPSHHLDDKTPRRPPAVLKKPSKERRQSITSSSTGLSSLRSAATAAESFSNSRRSQLSFGEPEWGTHYSGDSGANRPSTKPTAVSTFKAQADPGLPGKLLAEPRRQKKRDPKSSGGNCILQ